MLLLTIKKILSLTVRAVRQVRNILKINQLYPLGLRAHHTCSIAWSVSVDGGGKGGRVIVGRNTVLDEGAVLRAAGGLIRIGDDCSVNPYCVLIGGSEGLVIGNGVRIAAHSAIVAENHIFEDTSKYMYLQGSSSKGIIIEDDVWIGVGAKILDGVTIQKGTIVAAGAVVTKSTESYSIVAGVPAKKISSRNRT